MSTAVLPIFRKPEMHFVVLGPPVPQGSMRAFMPKGWSRPIITSANAKLKPWRQAVSSVALEARKRFGWEILSRNQGVRVEADFFFQRPRSVKPGRAKTTKPDVDKLARGLMDGMTSIVFEDDSQVVECVLTKRFGTPERTEVRIRVVE